MIKAWWIISLHVFSYLVKELFLQDIYLLCTYNVVVPSEGTYLYILS